MKKWSIKLLGILGFFSSLFTMVFIKISQAATTSSMDSVLEGLNTTADAGGFNRSTSPDLYQLSGKSINLIIALQGLVILGLTVYSGFLYIKSQGDKKKAEDAQKILTYTIAGAVIILASYALANFVLGGLQTIFNQ